MQYRTQWGRRGSLHRGGWSLIPQALWIGALAWLLGIAGAAVSSELPPDILLAIITLLIEGLGFGLVSFAVGLLTLIALRAHPDRLNKSVVYTAGVGVFLFATQFMQAGD